MALTTDLLNASTALAGLTDDQKAAIVEMSKNDENAVIGQKTGEIYGGLDADILAASGIAKNGATEKTYDYAKRVIGEIKGQAGNAAELQSKVSELEKEKSRLEGVIAKGGADAETKRALEKARADLADVTKSYTDLKTEFESVKTAHAKEMFDAKIAGEFAKATAGIKFKADLPASVTAVLLEQAVAKVKGMNPEYIDDGNGGKVLAFMENGVTMRNKENNLNPYTASELVARELSAMGVLETGRKQTGAGSEGGAPHGGEPGIADISGARTQEEAHDMIAKALMAQGKTRGSKEFDDAMAAAWKENATAIKALPVK
jgi:hypothetical protein